MRYVLLKETTITHTQIPLNIKKANEIVPDRCIV